jgi:hypothetical protein
MKGATVLITIKKLIETLSRYDENMGVVMSSDSEGNNTSPLDEIENFYYRPETTWYGELIDPVDIHQHDLENEGIKQVVVLYPVN